MEPPSQRYSDFEQREYDRLLGEYQASLTAYKQSASYPKWKCSTCGYTNSEGFHDDAEGFWGQYCSVRSCQYSTLLFKKPQLVYKTINKGYYDHPDPKYPAKLAKYTETVSQLVKSNPLPAELRKFDWKWIHPTVRQALESPTSRAQVLQVFEVLRTKPFEPPAVNPFPDDNDADVPGPVLMHQGGPAAVPHFPHPAGFPMQPMPQPMFPQPLPPNLAFPGPNPLYGPQPRRTGTPEDTTGYSSGMNEAEIRKDATKPLSSNAVLAATCQLFSPEFCKAFMEYSQAMERHEAWRAVLRDLHGVPMNLLQMEPLFQELAQYMTKAAQKVELYANHTIKFQHGFTLSFSSSRRDNNGHFNHKDDAALTVNTCLGGDFSQGNLRLRAASDYIYAPQKPGVSIFHNGNTQHQSDATLGFRQNLILFFDVEPSFQYWPDLPADVQALILSFAGSPAELASYERLSKDIRSLCKQHDELLWGRCYQRTFKLKASAQQPNSTAKQKFITQFQKVSQHYQNLVLWDKQHPYIPMKTMHAAPRHTPLSPQFKTIFTHVKGDDEPVFCPIQ